LVSQKKGSAMCGAFFFVALVKTWSENNLGRGFFL